MDANQVLHLRLFLKDSTEQEFESTVENPLTAIENSNVRLNQILELEEKMRSGGISKREQQNIVMELAELECKESHKERALSYLVNLNRSEPNSRILNKMGIIAGELGDHDREEKFYREAARISLRNSVPLFNLAHSQHEQSKQEEAMKTIDEAIDREQDSPYLILKAAISDKLKQPRKVQEELLKRAFKEFGNLESLNDYEFSWYDHGANLAGDASKINDVEKERQRRRKRSKTIEGVEGILPELKNELTKRTQ